MTNFESTNYKLTDLPHAKGIPLGKGYLWHAADPTRAA